ncbi:MAG TPA: glycosyltransferase [Anaerolineales bacterium]|nr:glycosyltransferase [Anaerolineales bacterium]
MIRFPGKLAVQQRVLPNYRASFFDLLASACDGGTSLFTGLPRPMEGITTAKELRAANYVRGNNFHFFSGSLYLCYQQGLLDWLKKWNPDALIVEANPRYLSTASAAKWMHKHNKPVLGWGLGSPPVSGFRRQRRFSFVSQFDALISYSQRGAEEYAALGFPRDKIFVAHNSVSAPPSSPLPARPLTFDVRPNILFVGRLQARKRIDSLLRACAQMAPSPRLVIIGDGPERKTLEPLAKEIYPGAEFIGAKHGAELKPYFEAADLFVLPGTGGLAVQEAMSYGLPVIVAQGDGTQDDLVRKENGWQIPPDDFEALVSTMKDALADVARLRKMGTESYRIVRDEINIEKMVETFVGALNLIS